MRIAQTHGMAGTSLSGHRPAVQAAGAEPTDGVSPPEDSGTFLGMNGTHWRRVGTVALGAGLGSLALAPFGELGLVSEAVAGFFGGLVLGNGLTNKGPFPDGLNALINLAMGAAGLVAVPMIGYHYGALAAAGAAAAATGAGAAVIGSGPIRNWSTGIVRDLHAYIRQEEYQA